MTTTPTCFQVAVADTLATTDLAQISACVGKKKRSIDDSPLEDVKQAEISPSREEIQHRLVAMRVTPSLLQIIPYAYW